MRAPLVSFCFSSYFAIVTACVVMPEHTKVISHAGVPRSDGEFLEMCVLYLSYGKVSVCYLLLDGSHTQSPIRSDASFFPLTSPSSSGAPS